VRVDGPARSGLAGDVGRVGATRPRSPVLLDERHHLVRLHVAGDDERRVLGPVPAIEEHLRVRELIGHVLDVLQEAHRRVPVGVRREGVLALDLEELARRIGAVLVVLAEHGARLGLERLFGIGEVLEPVGLDLEDRRQILLGERRVVVRVVVAGVGVLARPGALEDRLVGVGGICLRAPEHHVLEEVGEPRLAGLDLVARPGLHRNVQRHDVGEARRDDDDREAVGERAFGRREGEQGCLRDPTLGRRPGHRGCGVDVNRAEQQRHHEQRAGRSVDHG
jgi:hypothetical protein